MSWRSDGTNWTAAEAAVEALRLLAVERVFGLPGIQGIELFDALADAPFPTFTPTNESAAIFMADAYGRVTGKVGVAVVTSGPGLTNALTGIAEARLDSSPLMVLVTASGEVPGKSFQLHQIRQNAVVEPLVKGGFKPATAEEVPQAVLRAAELACQGEPGPTLVELPSTLLMERSRFRFSTVACPPPPQDIGVQLDAAADQLRHSPSVGIYAGAGAVTATDELRELAELLQAPVATTISGRGVISEDHPLGVGYGFGRSGTAAAWRVFRKIQTLLAVGCKYGETATGAYGVRPPREHIHIDINPASLGANHPASLAIASDAKIALRGLLARLERDRRPANSALQAFIAQARARCERKVLTVPALAAGVTPSWFLRLLRRSLERDAILVTDSGSHQFWALSDFPIYAPRTFLAPADFQAMGFSIPAAISAKLAFPARQVVSLVGDGGFLISGFECLNAVRWGAKIIVVVFRDGAWGLIKEAQRRVYRRTPFTQLPSPDFQILAQSFGMEHVRVTKDTDIELGINQALATEAPTLVEVNIDYAEPPPYVKGAGRQMFRNLPPRLKAGVALRFAKRWFFPPRTKQP
jgi:acetolactate synthase-1/2/3 large subunit